MSWFRAVYEWVGQRTFYRWPSWVTEALSGLLAVALVLLVMTLLHGWLVLLVLATALSIVYELKLDPNGWSVKDCAQREVGILVGLAVAILAGWV